MERITYLVYTADYLTPALEYQLQCLIGHLWYARMQKATIITSDDYASLSVVRAADRFGLKYRTYGIRSRARSGVRPYTRVIASSYDERDQFMIGAADACFFIGERTQHLRHLAERLGKRVYDCATS